MFNGALPAFDLTEGGLPLSLTRSLTVVSLFSVYGALIFHVFVAPRALARLDGPTAAAIERRLLRLIRWSLAVNAAGLVLWLIFESSVLADEPGLAALLDAARLVLSRTDFGRIVEAQLAATLAIAWALGRGDAVSGRRWRIAAGLGVLATMLHAGHSHALAIERGPSLLLASDALHLLCAGGWLGGLIPLLLFVRDAPPPAGATAARYFSPLGKLCLYGLLVTAAYQAWELMGGLAGVVGTAYGWMALVKLMLFGILFGFAWFNRYRFAPAMLGPDGIAAKRTLIRSITLQAGFGLAIVIAAGLLANLAPGVHTEPVWPFTEQPSLVTIEEAPELRPMVVGAVALLGLATLLLALAAAIRRVRWPALILALGIGFFAIRPLGLLFVPAYPTSFYHSPTRFTASAIAIGASLYPQHCAACHGTDGRGDGPDAGTLPVPPADLTAAHLWGHSDGELFWWLTHGIEGPEGGLVMPGFAAALTDDQRWDLIDYVRAHNAGIGHGATGTWLPPVKAPDLLASCPDKRRIWLSALHGKVVRLVFAGARLDLPPLPPSSVALATIIVPEDGTVMTRTDAGCIATDPQIRTAYGIIAGLPPERLAGSQFLIDPNGWLRAVAPAGADGSQATDPAALIAEIEQICRHPLEDQGSADAHHHHS